MKKINFKKYIVLPLIALLLIGVSGCETIDTDLTDDPSNLGEDEASLEFLFNANQLQIATFFEAIQFTGAEVCRMELMNNSPVYLTQYEFSEFNGVWVAAYSSFLRDAQLTKQLADNIEGDANGNNIRAAVQIMESYVITSLVDQFGDVPFSEALQGSDNFNPGRDAGEDIYQAARDLLINAIALIQAGNSVPLPNDLYYGGDMSNWEQLANSLLLRLTIQSRLENPDAAAQFNALVSAGNFITNNNNDFQFNYSNVREPVDSRHPNFGSQYDAVPLFYQSQDFMERMFGDPRFNYYYYQQDNNTGPNPNFPGIFGRYHGDASPGIASEFTNLTVYGLYPVGGAYNDGSFNGTGPNDGAAGAGASVIMTNFATQFYLAEGLLMINGNVGAARTALEAGIEASMDKVTSFRNEFVPDLADDDPFAEPSNADIQAYIDARLAAYDAAGSNEARLDVIISEFYKALWGNGLDVYNNFRRTSYPSDLSPSVSPNPGVFTNSMWYPANYVNNNNNPDAQQKPTVGVKVWWAENTSFNLDF